MYTEYIKKAQLAFEKALSTEDNNAALKHYYVCVDNYKIALRERLYNNYPKDENDDLIYRNMNLAYQEIFQIIN